MGDTKSDIVVGQVSTYWGGGYIADIGYSAFTAYPVRLKNKCHDYLSTVHLVLFRI